MKIKRCLIWIILLLSATEMSWGFSLLEPKSGAVFQAGDTVTIKAKQDSGENIKMVFLGALKMGKGTMATVPPYQYSFIIDKDFVGTETILASAKLDNNQIIEAKVDIQVLLPANIILKGISVDPTRILLQKLPEGSEPNKVSAYETRSIGVGGIYSDGIQRYIASSSDGTTYTSSNENVVTVDKEGKVFAQGIGKAKITVRNGNFSATVDVLVNPFKK